MQLPTQEHDPNHWPTTQELEHESRVASDLGSSQSAQPPNLEELGQRNAELKGRLAALQQELKRMDQHVTQAEASVYDNRQIAHASQKEAEYLQNVLSIEAEQNRRRNAERKIELESLKAFLDNRDNTDPSSVEDRRCEVNALIERLAIDLSLRWEIPVSKTSHGLSEDTGRQLKTILGSHLISALFECNIRDEVSLTILRYAFQVALSFSAYHLFHRASNTRIDRPILDLSRKVREDEIQPVYGRWRSVTYRYLRLIQGKVFESDMLLHFIRDTIIDLYHIGCIFGLPFSPEVYEKLKVDLRPLLAEIGNKTMRLALATTEEVISKDYQLYKPEHGPFDPVTMQTPFPLRRTSAADKVIGVVSLGMVYTGKPGRQYIKPESFLFRQATVITDRAIAELIESAQINREQIGGSDDKTRVQLRGTAPSQTRTVGPDMANMTSSFKLASSPGPDDVD